MLMNPALLLMVKDMKGRKIVEQYSNHADEITIADLTTICEREGHPVIQFIEYGQCTTDDFWGDQRITFLIDCDKIIQHWSVG